MVVTHHRALTWGGDGLFWRLLRDMAWHCSIGIGWLDHLAWEASAAAGGGTWQKLLEAAATEALKTSCTEGLTDYPKVLKTSCTEGLTDDPKVLKTSCTEGLTDYPKVLKTSCNEGLRDDPKVLKTSSTKGLTDDPKGLQMTQRFLKTSSTEGLTDDPKMTRRFLKTSCTQGLTDDPKVLKTSCTEGLTDDPKVLKTSCTQGLTDDPKVLKTSCTEGLTDDPKVLRTSSTEGLTDDPMVLKTSSTEWLTDDPKVLKTSSTKGLIDDPKVLKTSSTEGLIDDPKVLKTSSIEGLIDDPKMTRRFLKTLCTKGITDDPKVLKTSCTEGLTDDLKVLKISCTEGLTDDPKVFKTSCTKGLTDVGNSLLSKKTMEIVFLLFNNFTDIDSSSDTEEILNSDSNEENKLLYLTKMVYSEAEASIAMEKCDSDSSITELTDFICAAQMVRAADTLLSITQRTLPEDAIGPPYFYYENVTLAPVDVWTEMSRDAEVVLYRLIIPLKENVQELNGHQLEQLMSRFVEFDLVVGVTVSSASSRHVLPYPTLPEPWKGEHHKFNSPNFLASQTT
ncbi:hypothetical protein F3Y22_tig00110151pilonHSYRG00210 [Hibiscus syriacus]|uniref:Uncharacterized protein n=1 Tax=Hibiscus syriacus TaxID=106335 RepID=A0A6A3BJ19_HIBSY|nr:hypothetical protein F3Y22_tig00110151pilonHSYRG00210 [Hibiscus syriacus]